MTAAERQLNLHSVFMDHNSGTKHYAVFTITDTERDSSVGIQVWGEVGKVSGVKFITGTTAQVLHEQNKKVEEKKRSRNGGKYTVSGSPNADYSVRQTSAALKARLLNLGAEPRKADEIADEAMSKFGMSFAQTVEAKKEEAKIKTAEERKAQGADYGGAWGAW